MLCQFLLVSIGKSQSLTCDDLIWQLILTLLKKEHSTFDRLLTSQKASIVFYTDFFQSFGWLLSDSFRSKLAQIPVRGWGEGLEVRDFLWVYTKTANTKTAGQEYKCITEL